MIDTHMLRVFTNPYGDRITFIRPVANWIEEVEVDGKKVKRFTKV